MGRGGGGGEERRYCYREVFPFTAIVAMECANVGLNTLFKLATRHGMSRHVFLVYAYAIAALLLLPAPFFSRRSPVLPSLNFVILSKIFLLAVVGYTSQIMGYTGINYASPTLASAMSNLSPAFTFVLAVIFRMEKLVLSSKSSRAKVVGTVVSISGAFVVTFYKGPSISSSSSTPVSLHQSVQSTQSNWMIGSLFLAVEYVLVAIWYIIQTHIMKGYPAESTVVFFYTFCVSILAAVVGFFAEEDSSKWTIRPSVALASVLCSGIFGCCLNNIVHTWALHLRGPVYVTMFKPLSIAIAAAMGVIILGDTLYLGSIIGATIIAIGFYTVMWGKTKEELVELDVDTADLESSAAQKYPPCCRVTEQMRLRRGD
ncbi:UNVERIFIED_CONTAM: WAT1-related protein [Sesamum radiatum]|uniref:WAT1-related protein n=1 Tax=Sesamum radiatum TaxID=300843 RepID=A0AAW2P8I3_SESRA